MGGTLGLPKKSKQLLAAQNYIFPKGKKINILVVFSSFSPRDSIYLGGIPYYIIIYDFKNTARRLSLHMEIPGVAYRI